MTDPAPSPHDEQVRRLLAEARHDEPIPPEVGARLDGVLADLAAERETPPVPPPPLGPPPPPGPPAPVVDLGARRRRRQGAALLLAAAAVVVVGVGVGTVVDGGGDAENGSAGGSSESFDRTEPDSAQEEGAAAPSAAPTESAPGALKRMEPLAVSSDTFAADAERYRGEALSTEQEPGAPQQGQPTDFPCDLGSAGPGVLVPVLYDGAEAVLAYRPPTDDAQVVDLLQCGTGDVVRTTTLPGP